MTVSVGARITTRSGLLPCPAFSPNKAVFRVLAVTVAMSPRRESRLSLTPTGTTAPCTFMLRLS